MIEAEKALEQYVTGADLEGLARLMQWAGWVELQKGTPYGTLTITLEPTLSEGVRCRRSNGKRLS